MVMTPATEGVESLVTSMDQLKQVAARFPDAAVVTSPTALEKELRHGFEKWQKFRDQLLED